MFIRGEKGEEIKRLNKKNKKVYCLVTTENGCTKKGREQKLSGLHKILLPQIGEKEVE